MKLSNGDLVVVLSGNYKGVGPAKVVSISYRQGVVSVDGVNRRVKHVKKGHVKSPQGGRVVVYLPIHVSNVAVYCKFCNKGVSIKSRLLDGKKCRVCCVCGSQI